jgi:hypothetical protein
MDRGGSGTERAGGFEVQADPQSARLPAGSRYASGGDICEILVGATQIVEIRIVTAKCGQIQELPGIEAETPAGRKHSRPGSAKYYRTRGTRAECRAGGLQASFSQGIAAPVAGKLRKWVRWAMRNVGAKGNTAEFWWAKVNWGGEMEAQQSHAPQVDTRPIETGEPENYPVEALEIDERETPRPEPAETAETATPGKDATRAKEIRASVSEVQEAEANAAEAQGQRAYAEEVQNLDAQVTESSLEEDETQLAAIRELMKRACARGIWLSLAEIAEATEFAEASISAQLRHLRKVHHGGHRVEKRRRGSAHIAAGGRQKVGDARRGPVIWEYRVRPRAWGFHARKTPWCPSSFRARHDFFWRRKLSQ